MKFSLDIFVLFCTAFLTWLASVKVYSEFTAFAQTFTPKKGLSLGEACIAGKGVRLRRSGPRIFPYHKNLTKCSISAPVVNI